MKTSKVKVSLNAYSHSPRSKTRHSDYTINIINGFLHLAGKVFHSSLHLPFALNRALEIFYNPGDPTINSNIATSNISLADQATTKGACRDYRSTKSLHSISSFGSFRLRC